MTIYVRRDVINQLLYTAEVSGLIVGVSGTHVIEIASGKLYRFMAQGKLVDFDELIMVCRLLGIHGISLCDIGNSVFHRSHVEKIL